MKQHKPDVRQPNLNLLGEGPQRIVSNDPRMQQRKLQSSVRQNYAPEANHVRSRSQSTSGNPNMTMRNPNSRNRKRKKKLTGKQITMRVLLAVLFILILTGVGAYLFKNHLENQMTYIPTNMNPTMIDEDGSIVSLSNVATETTTMAMPVVSGVKNILLIGIDSRSNADSYSKDGSGNLADIIMILTLNESDNTIKLTSVQRDSYVYIPGYTDPQKINAAMTYGGPPLLMLVLESHLRIDLEQYAFVDMNHMEKVIDAVGGVTVNVSEAERSSTLGLNDLIEEQNKVFGSPEGSHMLTETGDVTLDGRQAVAYARIRHVGNGDYDRSKRQIEVLQSLMSQFMNLGVLDKANAMADILSLISTNMEKGDIDGYALNLLPNIKSAEFEYLQVPMAGYSNEGTYSDFRSQEWSIRPNWNGIIPVVQEYMYGTTFPFDAAPIIPQAPSVTPTPTETPANDDTQSGGN